jgi:hypothetical protein
VTFTTVDLNGAGAPTVWYSELVTLGQGPGAMVWLNTSAAPPFPAGNTTVLLAAVTDETNATLSEHMVQLVPPVELQAPKATLSFDVANTANPDGSIDVVVASDKVALFVTLTTLAPGRFSDNCFFLPATRKTVRFIPFVGSDQSGATLASLKSSLRLEDHSMYMHM